MKREREFYNRIRPEFPVAVLYAGEQRCAPGHHSEGVRTHYLLHYVLEGTGTVRLGSANEEIGPGDGFLFGPDQPHAYRASVGNPWHYVWVGFSGSAAESVLADSGAAGGTVIRGGAVLPELREHFFDLVSTLRVKARGYTLRSDGYLLLILSSLTGLLHATERPAEEGRPSPQSYVEEAFAFIHANFQRDIDVGSIVDYVGLERSYFSAMFHRETGQSIQEYLIAYRMRKAREYLRDTAYSVTDVAASVGYDSYFSFARRFRRVTGETASDYRKRTHG